jgi:hypothetical protein
MSSSGKLQGPLQMIRRLPHCPIPVRPRNAGCDNGPLMVGAPEGDASGAGILLANGACGVGGAKRVVTRA